MNKKILSVLSVVVIIATVGLNTLVVSNGSSKNILKMDLIGKVFAESTSSNTSSTTSNTSSTSSNNNGGTTDYCPYLGDDLKDCTLYSKVNLSTGAVVSTSDTSIAAEAGYEITSKQGIKVDCPKSGNGCTVYACK